MEGFKDLPRVMQGLSRLGRVLMHELPVPRAVQCVSERHLKPENWRRQPFLIIHCCG